MVGRNEIAKPWYTKSIMPAEIKSALSKKDSQKEKHLSREEKKELKKEKKRDIKR